jgi:MFS family permease
MVTALVPSYVSECTPQAIRGRCTGLIQLAINMGMLLSCVHFHLLWKISTHFCRVWVNYFASKTIAPGESQWRVPFAIQYDDIFLRFDLIEMINRIVPGVLFLLVMPFQPESPRYMVEKDEYDSAARTLAFLSRTTPDDPIILATIEEIKADFGGKRMLSVSQQIMRMCESRAVALRSFIPALVMFFQQWTGTNAINYFSPQIFASLGISETTAGLFATGRISNVDRNRY